MNHPERDPWPSVEDKYEERCPHCDATPEERHQPDCPLDTVIDADDIHFCDTCGHSYVTTCDCDRGDDDE